MDTNSVKKLLYRTSPIADLIYIKDGKAYYTCPMEDEEDLTFEIPVTDMGEARFGLTMEAKLLIRWLQ